MKKVGQILQEKRKSRGLSLNEVASATKIRKQILVYLEDSDWEALPSPTFTKGLLKNYGRFLGLVSEELLAFYRREFDEKKVKVPTQSLTKPPLFRLTPKLVGGFIISLAVVSILTYLFIQYQSFTGVPLLEVSEPKDNTKVENGQVNVVGKTWPDATLKINGQAVQLSPGGTFSEAVSLAEGINTITITSANRFGNMATEKRTIIAALASSLPGKELNSKLEADVKVGPSAAFVSIEIDGKTSFEGVLVAGSGKKIQAKSRIRILSKNAGSTKVIFQGSEFVLGKEGETAEKSFPL